MLSRHPLIPLLLGYHSKNFLLKADLEVLAAKRSRAVVEYLNKSPALQSRVSIGANEVGVFDVKEGVSIRLELSVH